MKYESIFAKRLLILLSFQRERMFKEKKDLDKRESLKSTGHVLALKQIINCKK